MQAWRLANAPRAADLVEHLVHLLAGSPDEMLEEGPRC